MEGEKKRKDRKKKGRERKNMQEEKEYGDENFALIIQQNVDLSKCSSRLKNWKKIGQSFGEWREDHAF